MQKDWQPQGYKLKTIEGDEASLKIGDLFTLRHDINVMDTWFTSSLTPQISASIFNKGFSDIGSCLDKSIFPFDLRPQAHEIIRTWALYTMFKSFAHNGSQPWRRIMISGWCIASNGDKMSKSKGNIIEPGKLLTDYGSDAVRYWSANSNLGHDTRYDENILKIGRRLVMKIENAGKFLAQFAFKSHDPLQDNNKIICTVDKWVIIKFNTLLFEVTEQFEQFNYFKVLEKIETFFWRDFCDNYLEICKLRCYGQHESVTKDENLSALTACFVVFDGLLKLFAPFLPFVTEATYLSLFKREDGDSVHKKAMWPVHYNINADTDVIAKAELLVNILELVRKFKAHHSLSIKDLVDCDMSGDNSEKIMIDISKDFSFVAGIRSIAYDNLEATDGDKVLFGDIELNIRLKVI